MPTFQGKRLDEMTREELEQAVIFLTEMNRKLMEIVERLSAPNHA